MNLEMVLVMCYIYIYIKVVSLMLDVSHQHICHHIGLTLLAGGIMILASIGESY